MEDSTSESKYSEISTEELEQLLHRLSEDSERKLVQAELIRRYRDDYEELSQSGGSTYKRAPDKLKSPKKTEPTNQPQPSSRIRLEHTLNKADAIKVEKKASKPKKKGRNKFWVVFFLGGGAVLLLLFFVFFADRNNTDPDIQNNPLVGNWQVLFSDSYGNVAQMSLQFTIDGSYRFSSTHPAAPGFDSGRYTVSNDTIYMTSASGTVYSFQFQSEGNMLMINMSKIGGWIRFGRS